MTSTSKQTKLIATTAYYLAFIILGLTTAISGPSLPTLAENTSTGVGQISLIFVFGSFGYLVGSYFGGRAFDRIPGHKLMAGVLLLMGIASVFIPISNTLGVLLLFMFLSGLATGTLDVGCNTLLLWTHGEESGPFINGLHFFFGVGAFIAPLLLVKVLVTTGTINWTYWTFAILCLPIAIWLWFLPEPSHQMHSAENKKTPLPLIPVLLCSILFFLYVGLELSFGNWIYTYALTLDLGTTITAAYLTSAFWGMFTVGRLLGVWVSTRARPKTIIFMDLLGCAIGTLIIMAWKDSTPALWIGTVALGLSMASIFPTIFMLAGEKMLITGTIAGWLLVGSGAGSMAIPWLIGQLFALTGPSQMTTVLLVDIVGMVFILLIFLNQRVVPIPEQAITSE